MNEMAESNKRTHKLEDEMANIRGKWEEEKRKNKEIQSELTKIREEKSRMAAKLKEQKEEMNAMTELLTETANTTTPQQTITPKGLFIADSNGREIKLPDNHQWTRPDNIYTIEHLTT